MGDDLPPVLLGELVGRFGGELTGDPSRVVTGVASLEDAGPSEVSFLGNRRYRALVEKTQAACVLIAPADALAVSAPVALWVGADPYVRFARIAQFFDGRLRVAHAPGIHPSAVVDPRAKVDPSATVEATAVVEAGAQIGANAFIGAGAFVGAGSVIGAASHLSARVTVYHGCRIGIRALIHAGAVIGADGFGFARDGVVWLKIPQTGGVVIGDDVEIGANTTIDRGALGDTLIGNGVKIDNQVQIAHNVKIGEHTAIAGCVGVAGSATIGKRCMIGGAAMILGHLELADDVSISVGTVISHSIAKPGLYTGFYPASENAAWEKSAAAVRHLDQLRDRVRALERQLKKDQGSS